MNNQERHFADQEWHLPQQSKGNTDPHGQEPSIPPPIHTDPREQPGWQTPPTPEQERTYTGSAPYVESQSEKIGGGQYAQRPRKRRSFWLWLIVVVIAFVLIGRIATLFSGSHPFFCPPPPLDRESAFKPISFPVGAHPTSVTGAFKPISFSVGAHPTIMIGNGFATTDVHVGSAKTVTITPISYNVGFPNPPGIDYDQSKDSNTITVMVNVPIDVTVPSNADLQVDTNTGEIDVTGVSGQMSLSTTSGSINFNGSIDPHGTYQFYSTVGSVNVTLPGSSSFHVDAWTYGSISSAFPEVNIQKGLGKVCAASAYGDVGSPPRARVILITTDSSISLNTK